MTARSIRIADQVLLATLEARVLAYTVPAQKRLVVKYVVGFSTSTVASAIALYSGGATEPFPIYALDVAAGTTKAQETFVVLNEGMGLYVKHGQQVGGAVPNGVGLVSLYGMLLDA